MHVRVYMYMPHLMFMHITGVEKLDYCLTRGGPFIDPLHLRMCTVCNSLREMEESIWPRFINEAVCSPDDASCLLVQGTRKSLTLIV